MATSHETRLPAGAAPVLDTDAIIIGAGISGMYQLYRCNCSPPAHQVGFSAVVAARAERMASRAVRPLRRPVATMEQISA